MNAVRLTSAERSVWLASMFSADPLSYNAASIVEINGALETQRLIRSLERALTDAGLLRRRVVAQKNGVEWREDSGACRPPRIFLIENAQTDPLHHLRELFAAAPIRGDGAPLIGAHVLMHRADRHFVMLQHHHVLLDFQGAATLLDCVAAIYNGENPVRLQDCRADIARAESAYLGSSVYREDECYWRERMRGVSSGALSNLSLDCDAGKTDLTISHASFAAFAATAKANGATPFQALLLIAYAYLAQEHAGDIVFGVPLAGRDGGALNSQSRMLPFRVGPQLAGQYAASAIRVALKQDIERARFPIWDNAAAIFPGAQKGALPKIAMNYLRAKSFRFGDAMGTIARLLYGERNADTYVRCVEEAGGQLSISVDSVRDGAWRQGLGEALATGVESHRPSDSPSAAQQAAISTFDRSAREQRIAVAADRGGSR